MNGLFGSSSWLYIILVGFFVGLLGRFFMPGNNRMGCLLTIVLGIIGALLAGWFGQYMGWYAAGEPAGFFGAVVGAVVVLAILRLFSGRR
ncbi:GlsB/YeaQ/YmgE family stress response membrane protein [Stenotrophomonas maltophilia]|uniref:Transglycosylase-associated protein n=1 Tax=Stenotrophomonas maltophilia (strain R551-3) TaxID=391008 RepID=B4SN37_STRM5|nr:GlsB/YeaQ/YmgE family stress response membrane protein [Stenotrophomonas maltophilia]ACF50682.1 Transglycosylase-associated protein [Stenotrophomonas maltophilia R551-3]MBA0397186.1 GlsB/YeaQ/YmgE family stress response membrane protein [Stenotrophomonas maltophilia]MBH1495239.1 GlsB/YeaQ/YmgE family stress response membrane protein [Stenotrophomonas maltophilia]MBN4961975.1 GlsB/YeaQ/YmgE family stress response membrane protein [Stenotrophomonas maltophilia]MBN5144802.1 GlsB/YeaQ/YmgE fami